MLVSRITVIGGTGYVGSAIVREAVSRGHEVTVFSRHAPAEPVEVTYVQGTVDDSEALATAIAGADAVVASLSPRGDLAGRLRPAYRTVTELAARSDARLCIVGGFSALRPAADAPRFVAGGDVPPQFKPEAEEIAAVLTDDLPGAPAELDWVYISPGAEFGAYAPGERLGRYRIGGEVALFDDHGKSAISGADFATAVVDVIEGGEHHRAHVGVAY